MGIRDRRKSLKMTQEELAQKAGVSRQTVGNLENGLRMDIKIATLKKIAMALNCKVEEILPQEGEEDDDCDSVEQV